MLDAKLPGRWRRLEARAFASYTNLCVRAGWRIRLRPRAVVCPSVDHLLVVIDELFPDTQPRVIAPQLVEDGTWPHVEGKGLLCLSSTRIGADMGERVAQHIVWAVDLLNLDEAKRKEEFHHEFGTYWGRRLDKEVRPNKRARPTFTSLVAPRGPSREIFYFADWLRGEVVLADGQEALTAWLRNTGRNPGRKQIERTRLAWLDEPPLPSEFPELGSDVLKNVPGDSLAEMIRAGSRLPILLGAQTKTGSVWGGVLLEGAPLKEITKGFRSLQRVPSARIVQSIAGRPVRRCTVQRADGAYVHGRDHDPEYENLAGKATAIVGCGALGASVARLLAQAGVGRFLLVDHDVLGTQNTARHLLGYRFVGQYKTRALAKLLAEDFPHLRSVETFEDRIERMSNDRLSKLASCDLVISAGIDFLGDAMLDRWRQATEGASPHLCTWIEPYALAGHAIVLFGTDCLLEAFDADGRPTLALTNWPKNSVTVIAEAGCGNTFQPHGAIDLQSSVVLASRLAVDVLKGAVASSSRRTWQGDLDQVRRHGGTPSREFVVSNIERSHQWPPAASVAAGNV